jgi:hypothetical protein
MPAYNGTGMFERPVPARFPVSTDGKFLDSYAQAAYMQRTVSIDGTGECIIFGTEAAFV